MVVSLFNVLIAEKVKELVQEASKSYPPEVERGMNQERTMAIIHAALWAHTCRVDSTAAAYARMSVFEALGLKNWTFDEDESEALAEFRRRRYAEQAG